MLKLRGITHKYLISDYHSDTIGKIPYLHVAVDNEKTGKMVEIVINFDKSSHSMQYIAL